MQHSRNAGERFVRTDQDKCSNVRPDPKKKGATTVAVAPKQGSGVLPLAREVGYSAALWAAGRPIQSPLVILGARLPPAVSRMF